MFRILTFILFIFLTSTLCAEVLTFQAQAPESPGIYDAPENTVGCSPNEPFSPLQVHLIIPDAGINEDTGLLIALPGLSTGADCSPTPMILGDWHNSKNLVIATVFYRNLAYRYPTDFGKMNIGDVLRGTGAVLDNYELNKRRIYLFGGSGGGHMALQVYQATPHLWNEVHAHSGITKITTSEDIYNGYSTIWNANLRFPESQGSLSNEEWSRYQAERNLRGPQFHVLNDPRIGGSPIRIFHGTSDTLVNFKHFEDYRSNLFQALGVTAPPVFDVVTEIEQYTFIEVRGGNHYYNRVNISQAYFPDCFTSIANEIPRFSVDYTTSFSEGFAFRIYGNNLSETTVDVVRPNSSVIQWDSY